jgi:hypothetical protein
LARFNQNDVMALFFDKAWFDARLAARGLDRATLAASAGMSGEDLELAYKDQRELAPAEVRAFAALLGVDLIEAAQRCGITTKASEPGDRLDQFEERLDRVEQWIAEFEAAQAAAKKAAKEA